MSRDILDSLTAGIAVVNRDGVICEVNDAWRRFCCDNGGSRQATGVGVNYFQVCRSAKGDDSLLAARATEGIQGVLDGSHDVFRLEYPCHSPTEKRWFLLYVSPLKNDSQYAVTTHLPITDRKLVEQRLVEAERLAAIGQAMQGLSHEGRNALQRAQAHMDLLRCHIDEDTEALELVARIEIAQRHLLGLYEEVRSYAAPITLNRQSCRLDQLVDEVWSTYEAHPINASFSHVPAAIDLTCDIDVTAVGQVIRHVLDNALATGANPLEIRVSYEADLLDGCPAVTMIVSDNGPGILPEHWGTVFEPFYTTKTHGTGLGLAISTRILDAHGGRIRLGIPRQGGASVYITLPMSGRQKTSN